MTYGLMVILLFINSVLAFVRNHGKVFAHVFLFFMWVLFWSNSMNPDYNNYLASYNGIQLDGEIFNDRLSEFGYKLLMKLAVIVGLEFDEFRAVISAVAYMLIYSTVRKYTSNYSYVYVLYFLYPFFLDVVQIRNFLAMSILVFASQFLIEKSKLKFLISILVAATIHYASLLYIPMIITTMRRKNIVIKVLVISSILFSVIAIANNKELFFIDFLVRQILPVEKVMAWLDIRTNYGFLIFWVMQLSSFFMILYTKYLYQRFSIGKNNIYFNNISNIQRNLFEQRAKFIELVYLINLIAFIYLPLYLIAPSFTRLLRNFMILNYTAFAITNDIPGMSSNKMIIYRICIILYVLFFFWFDIYFQYHDAIIDAILTNNLLEGDLL